MTTESSVASTGTRRSPSRLRVLLQSGIVLTAISFLAAVGNFGLQVFFKRTLSAEEFGLLQAALGVLTILVIPVASAGQAVTHYIARNLATANEVGASEIRQSSLRILSQICLVSAVISALLIWPLTSMLGFPRLTITLWLIGAGLASLLSVLAGAILAGESRFIPLGLVQAMGVGARVLGGILLVLFVQANTESGLAASVIAALVFALIAFSLRPRSVGPQPSCFAEPPRQEPTTARQPEYQAAPCTFDFPRYLLASILTGLGVALFGSADILAAQRNFEPQALVGTYAAAGLFGRALLWGSFPFLVILFTHRSGQPHGGRETLILFLAYFGIVATGAVLLTVLATPLSQFMLGDDNLNLTAIMGDYVRQFALGMTAIAMVQGLAHYFLAARKLAECVTICVLGILYAAILLLCGFTPQLLLSLIFAGGSISVLILAMVALIRHGREAPY